VAGLEQSAGDMVAMREKLEAIEREREGAQLGAITSALVGRARPPAA